jgi:hypothetical protein
MKVWCIWTVINNQQPTTRGIKNCRDIGLFKGYTPLQISCTLIRNCSQTATFHTTKRSVQFASAVFQGIMQKYNKVLKKLELGSGVICSSFG